MRRGGRRGTGSVLAKRRPLKPWLVFLAVSGAASTLGAWAGLLRALRREERGQAGASPTSNPRWLVPPATGALRPPDEYEAACGGFAGRRLGGR